MARLIDADALLGRAIEERRFVICRENMLDMNFVFNTVYKDLADFINEAPTEDAVEVKHGRWECPDGDFSDCWKCSACGIEWFFEYDPTEAETKVNYCPECGAKMDGERRCDHD